jgi:hypothetical protein
MTTVLHRGAAPTWAKAFAAVGWVVTVASGIVALGLRVADPVPVVLNTFGMDDPRMIVFVILGISWATVGALLVVKRPENSVGRYLLLIGAAHALSILAAALTFSAWADGSDADRGIAGVTAWLTVLTSATTGLVLYVPLVFPNGRSLSRGWDVARPFFLISLIGFWVVLLFQPGPLQLFPQIHNPFGVGPDLRDGAGLPMAPVLVVWVAVAIPLYIGALVFRYRTADHVERQQIKWFLAAVGASLVSLVITGTIGLSADGSSGIPLAIYGVASTFIPVSIAIAILRHGLYDIDRLISRTLGYAVVTGVLVAVFAATAIGLSAILGSMAQGETLAVAASTLFVFAISGPLRRRAQSAVDRRFDRARYDASVTVQAMSTRLRDDVDLERVEADVLGVVDRTFHPTKASVWLR